jgi:hypothetical protein
MPWRPWQRENRPAHLAALNGDMDSLREIHRIASADGVEYRMRWSVNYHLNHWNAVRVKASIPQPL